MAECLLDQPRGPVNETAMSHQICSEHRFPGLAWRLLRRAGMADRTRINALEQRTKRFAISILHIVRYARRQPELRSACDQLNDAAGSVASNHRAVGRSRSTKEFAAKLQIVCEESDESVHWLSILREMNRDTELRVPIDNALQEAIELRNIFGKSRATTRDRYFPEQKPQSKRARH